MSTLLVNDAARSANCHPKTVLRWMRKPVSNRGLTLPVDRQKFERAFRIKPGQLDEFLSGADRAVTSTQAAAAFGLDQIGFFAQRRAKDSPIPPPVIQYGKQLLRWSANDVEEAAARYRNRPTISGCATPGTPDSYQLGPQGWSEV